MTETERSAGGGGSEYECLRCGRRLRSEHHPGACPDCEGEMQNLSVARQQ